MQALTENQQRATAKDIEQKPIQRNLKEDLDSQIKKPKPMAIMLNSIS